MTAGPRVWAFGGGKGGAGKSLICAAVGVELARRGHRVTAIDLDLGAANLHTLLGLLHPTRTLDDFLSGRAGRLADACVATEVAGLHLISGAAAILRAAHPRPVDKRRLVEAALQLETEVLLLDLGAGTHYNTLDFFNLAGIGLVITGPEPTSIQNAYAFVKAALFRRLERGLPADEAVADALNRAAQPRGPRRIESVDQLLDVLAETSPLAGAQARALVDDFRARLVVNQAGPREEKRVLGALGVVCRRYLGLDLPHGGTLPDDPAARRAVRRMKPVLTPGEPLAEAVGRLVDHLWPLPAAARPDLLLSDAEPVEPEITNALPRVVVVAPDDEAPTPADGVDAGGLPVAEVPMVGYEFPEEPSGEAAPEPPAPVVPPVEEPAIEMPTAEIDPVDVVATPPEAMPPANEDSGPAEPEVVEPEVAEPEVVEPEIAEPEIVEPEVVEPEVVEPEVVEPEVVEPAVVEPEVLEPEGAGPADEPGFAADDPWPTDALPDDLPALAEAPEAGAPAAADPQPDAAPELGTSTAEHSVEADEEASDEAEPDAWPLPVDDEPPPEQEWPPVAPPASAPWDRNPFIDAAPPLEPPLIDDIADEDELTEEAWSAIEAALPEPEEPTASEPPPRVTPLGTLAPEPEPPGFFHEDSLPDFDLAALSDPLEEPVHEQVEEPGEVSADDPPAPPPPTGPHAAASAETPAGSIELNVDFAFDDMLITDPEGEAGVPPMDGRPPMAQAPPTPPPVEVPRPPEPPRVVPPRVDSPRSPPPALPPPGMSRGLAAALARDSQAPPPAEPGNTPSILEYDPWADLELASQASRSEEPVSRLAPDEDWGVIAAPSRRQPGAPLDDPPGHEVVGLAEDLEVGGRRISVQTMDLAPACALVRSAVYEGGRLLGLRDRDYEDLLGADGAALDPRRVPARVETLHQETLAALAAGGLTALPWVEAPEAGPVGEER